MGKLNRLDKRQTYALTELLRERLDANAERFARWSDAEQHFTLALQATVKRTNIASCLEVLDAKTSELVNCTERTSPVGYVSQRVDELEKRLEQCLQRIRELEAAFAERQAEAVERSLL